MRANGLPVRRMPSGAGHDAVPPARVTDTAMLFVRCAGGISHHPDESVSLDDVAMAIGTCFIWGHIGDAARALVPSVKRGGYLALGEPYWRMAPPPGVEPEPFASLPETVARLESAGLRLTGIIAASQDDWDRYESLHWRAVEVWLAANPAHPDAAAIQDRHRASLAAYLEHERPLLGWAILVARKP